MINQDKLKNLAADFQKWRAIRQYPREKTPQHLKDEAIKLAQNYSPSQIQAALNISSSTFHNWRKKLSAADELNGFIALPELPEIASADKNSEVSIELTCKNGNKLQVSGSISLELLTAITGAALA
jgi:transposase-like protein